MLFSNFSIHITTTQNNTCLTEAAMCKTSNFINFASNWYTPELTSNELFCALYNMHSSINLFSVTSTCYL